MDGERRCPIEQEERSVRRKVKIAFAVAVAATGLLISQLPAVAAGRPVFQMPFPCGQTWRAYTHSGHAYPLAQLDWGQPPSSGKRVVASASGTVVGSGVYNDGVSYVLVDHGSGWQSRYLHMQTGSLARVGTWVDAGDPIGQVGDVGSAGAYHLHYEQRLNGIPQAVLLDGQPVTYRYYPNYATYTSQNCGSGGGSSSTRGDVTGDGKGDLTIYATAPNNTGETFILQGGNGTNFWDTAKTVFTNSAFMTGAKTAVTDIDGDGAAEIILARPASTTTTDIHIIKGSTNPTGLGTKVRTIARPVPAIQLTGGDVTGDGKGDLTIYATAPNNTGETFILQGGNGTNFWDTAKTVFTNSAFMTGAKPPSPTSTATAPPKSSSPAPPRQPPPTYTSSKAAPTPPDWAPRYAPSPDPSPQSNSPAAT